MTGSGEPKSVVCFGDSITWGFDPRGAETFQRYGFAERWTRRLQAALGDGYHVIEQGLNGRTTVFDDPVLGGMSGLADLPNVLKSHMPVDLLVLMLGTNDIKNRFGLNGAEIATAMSRLVDVALKSGSGPDAGPPQILLLVPPVLGPVDQTWLAPMFGDEKNRTVLEELRETYPALAAVFGIACFDTNEAVEPGTIDGVHLDPDMLEPFATAVAKEISALV